MIEVKISNSVRLSQSHKVINLHTLSLSNLCEFYVLVNYINLLFYIQGARSISPLFSTGISGLLELQDQQRLIYHSIMEVINYLR